MSIKEPIKGIITDIIILGPFRHKEYGEYLTYQYVVNSSTYCQTANLIKEPEANIGQEVNILYSISQGKTGQYNRIIKMKTTDKPFTPKQTKPEVTKTMTKSSPATLTKEDTSLQIKGVLHYPFLLNPDDTGKYRVSIQVDKSTGDTLAALGVSVKNKDTELKAKGRPLMGNFVNTQSTYAPTVIDASKNKITEESLGGTKIGNGTTAIVKVRPYEWNFKGKKGTSLGFSVIQILTLVEYKSSNLEGFTTQDGYVNTNDVSDFDEQ